MYCNAHLLASGAESLGCLDTWWAFSWNAGQPYAAAPIPQVHEHALHAAPTWPLTRAPQTPLDSSARHRLYWQHEESL
jgi:hypothetical protein